MIAFHHGLVDAFYFSTRSVATVAGPPGADKRRRPGSSSSRPPTWCSPSPWSRSSPRRWSAGSAAAGSPRSSARAPRPPATTSCWSASARSASASRRRCSERGVAVIAIERDAEAPSVRLAKAAGIPVALGRGDDREVLAAGRHRALRRVAAVTSDDLVNVAVGLAADDLRPDVPIVLRLGDGEVASRDRLPPPPRPHLRRPQTRRRDDAASDRSRRLRKAERPPPGRPRSRSRGRSPSGAAGWSARAPHDRRQAVICRRRCLRPRRPRRWRFLLRSGCL